MQRIAKQIQEQIKKAKKIALISHQEPDGDALGSLNAFYEYITGLGKKVVILSSTEINPNFSFLPHNEKIISDSSVFSDLEIDTIIVVDSSNLKHTRFDEQLINHPATIINIDHHATNERYGHLNMIIDNASSTTEIIYLFFHYNKIEINRHIATAILTGLITDTDNFTNSATTALSLAIAGEMTRYGANLTNIQKHTHKNKSLDTLKLWGVILSRLNKDEETEIAYTFIKEEDLKNETLDENAVSGIANFLNSLREAKIYAVLRETGDGKIKISLRTTENDVDVASIALTLGGGGHKKAAGATMDGTIEEAIKRILTIHKNNTIMKNIE